MGIITPQGILLDANSAALHLIQANRSDVIGKPFWETPWWSYSTRLQKRLKTSIARASQGKIVRFETEHIASDGKHITVDFSLEAVRNRQGKITHLVAEGRDITQRKRIENLRKEFLSAAAHELKTPITVLKLLTQSHIAKAKGGEDTISVNELELIDRELSRLTRIIDDILDSSRFETGQLFLVLKEINLVQLVQETIKKITLYAKNHTIFFRREEQDLFVTADAARIEQVLLNLLSNAVKYSPSGTKVTIAIEKKGTYAIVSIQDEGFGIAKTKQKIIFNKYYQIKKRVKNGFGLGLYISKEIVKRHHGRIWVESTIGKGSTFFFSLPLSKRSSSQSS